MPWNMRIEIGFSWNATFRSTHTQPIHLLMLTCPFLLFRDWSPIPQLCQDNSKNYNEQCQNCLNHPETCHIIYLLVVAQRKNLVIPCFSSIHLGIRAQMPQNQGMNWNFLEALPKRCGYESTCKAWTSGCLFSSPKISRVACGRLGANHKHGPGGWNVIVRRLAVCLTAGWNRLNKYSLFCKGVAHHILRNVGTHSNAVIIYKCIPKPVLHTYTKSLISPMKNWSQIDSWHPDHLNACDPKRPNVGSCIVSLRWTNGFESNSIPNKCHHSQSTKCVCFSF